MSHDLRGSKQQKPGIYYRYTCPTSALLHHERLRSHESGGFEVLCVRTEFGRRRAFSIARPTVWNELPNNIQRTDNVTIFKRVLKARLFKLAYDC